MLFVGAVAVNALAQAALRRFTQWPCIEHPTFQLDGGHYTNELIAARKRRPVDAGADAGNTSDRKMRRIFFAIRRICLRQRAQVCFVCLSPRVGVLLSHSNSPSSVEIYRRK